MEEKLGKMKNMLFEEFFERPQTWIDEVPNFRYPRAHWWMIRDASTPKAHTARENSVKEKRGDNA